MRSKWKYAASPGIAIAITGLAITIIILLIALASPAGSASGKPADIRQEIPAVSATHSDGHNVFTQTCQACHTIGGGALVGPDLLGVTDRRDREEIVSFIQDPTQFDAEMPNLGVSEADARAVLSYIEEESGPQPVLISEEGDAPQPVLISEDESTAVPVLISADTSTGRDYFTGKIRLENGGAACLSCHNVDGVAALGGGAVGPDLSAGYPNMNEATLTAFTEGIQPMAGIYGADENGKDRKPLTDEELTHLAAFLRDAGNQGSSSSPALFVIFGIAGCLVIVGLLQLIWRGRLSGVRQLLVKGGSK